MILEASLELICMDQGQGIFTLQDEFTHMAYIKYTNIAAHGLVFIIDASIGDGHVVACKLGHFSAKCLMEMGEGG